MVCRMGVGHGMAVDWSSGRAALHSVTAHHSTHRSTPPEYPLEPVRIPAGTACASPRGSGRPAEGFCLGRGYFMRKRVSVRFDKKRWLGAVYGVPALAGQAQFRHGSPSVASRLEGAAPCRLKPGLHALCPSFACERCGVAREPGQSGAAFASGHFATGAVR
jgi:hypothetical protein